MMPALVKARVARLAHEMRRSMPCKAKRRVERSFASRLLPRLLIRAATPARAAARRFLDAAFSRADATNGSKSRRPATARSPPPAHADIAAHHRPAAITDDASEPRPAMQPAVAAKDWRPDRRRFDSRTRSRQL